MIRYLFEDCCGGHTRRERFTSELIKHGYKYLAWNFTHFSTNLRVHTLSRRTWKQMPYFTPLHEWFQGKSVDLWPSRNGHVESGTPFRFIARNHTRFRENKNKHTRKISTGIDHARAFQITLKVKLAQLTLFICRGNLTPRRYLACTPKSSY